MGLLLLDSQAGGLVLTEDLLSTIISQASAVDAQDYIEPNDTDHLRGSGLGRADDD